MAPRKRRVVWTEEARRALEEALDYIAQDSPMAPALSWSRRLQPPPGSRHCQSVAELFLN